MSIRSSPAISADGRSQGVSDRERCARIAEQKFHGHGKTFATQRAANYEHAGKAIAAAIRDSSDGITPQGEIQAAIELAYGMLWHMSIDTRDPNLKLASDARKALLSVMDKDAQSRGICSVRTDGETLRKSSHAG